MKKNIRFVLLVITLITFASFKDKKVDSEAALDVPKMANPNATLEAKKLLKFLYSVSAEKKTLTGMHNQPGNMSVYTDKVYQLTGKYPAIWGGEFGFADSTHDTDNIKYRAFLVDEIKKQYARGSIIVLTYHQANPLIGEPCQFKGGVISKLSDEQWKELLTPGTPLYKVWAKQMDLFASYLIKLKQANIPVILRPYHEMNGSWFWWGGRPGEKGYIALWKQLFNYYTKHHELNNLIWSWNPDKPFPGVENYYPGSEYVDIVGTDIYPMGQDKAVYPQEYYDTMLKLANGKPLALTENSVLPNGNTLQKQPWVWFMTWVGMLFDSNSETEIKNLYNSEKVYTTENLPDWKKAK